MRKCLVLTMLVSFIMLGFVPAPLHSAPLEAPSTPKACCNDNLDVVLETTLSTSNCNPRTYGLKATATGGKNVYQMTWIYATPTGSSSDNPNLAYTKISCCQTRTVYVLVTSCCRTVLKGLTIHNHCSGHSTETPGPADTK